MLKGALLKDDSSGWNLLKPKLKNGVTLLMMGTKDEDALVTVKDSEKTQVFFNTILLQHEMNVDKNDFLYRVLIYNIISLLYYVLNTTFFPFL